jgi:glycosyltransferase involved in cell wall biosynthesis
MGMPQTGIPSVVTIHDLIFERHPEQFSAIDNRIYHQKFSYACKHADRVIAISQQTKSDIIQFYGTPASKIDICYQSCNPSFGFTVSEEEKLRIKQQYQLPERFFLYVGSIIERKNLLTICKGLKQVKQRLPYPLVVIGDGSKYKQTVKDYIQENGLDHDVIFLSEQFSNSSFKSAKDFPAIYQLALAMIYPSTFEGFGIPVLEALWSNIPVITSNVSCMPETGGNAAFYVEPLSADEMANAMYLVATDEDLRQAMIAKGWQHAQHFTQQKCAAGVMNVYEQLV